MPRPSITRRHASLVAFLVACALVFMATASARASDVPDILGPWDVGHRALVAVDAARNDRSLPLDVWYPVDPADAFGSPAFYPLLGAAGLTSEVGFEDAAVSSTGRRPLIVFSHGFGGISTQSIKLMEHLASHGFVVVSPTHTGNAQGSGGSPDPEADRYPDVAFVIDEMSRFDLDPSGPFFGRVDAENVGVAGHSFGGMTAQFMAAGHGPFPPDSRVKAIMPVAASSSRLTDAELAGITVPTLLMVGTLDGLQAQTIRAFGLISSAPFLYRVDVTGANHTHFANVCDIGNWLISIGLTIDAWPAIGAGALIGPYTSTCIPPAFSIAEATRIQNLYAAAHFRRHLLGETYYDPYLTGAYAAAREPDTAFFGGGPTTADPFMCYRGTRTVGTGRFSSRGIDLSDGISTETLSLTKTRGLCAPADKNGEGVVDDCTHLKSYRLKGGAPAGVAVTVEDSFGTSTLDLLRPDRLLVPAAKEIGMSAEPVGDSVDHFKCYKVRRSHGSPAWPSGVMATVGDQFQTRVYDLLRPRRLCVPVDKNGEGIIDATDHLLCYGARPADGARFQPIRGQIHTQDQFGAEALNISREDEFCVPARVVP